MRWCYLGRVPYDEALALQGRLRQGILRGACEDTLILVEHPPVITMGRSGRGDHILISEEERRRRGVEVVEVGRGGDVTYHGPGQLVGYPVRRVGRAVKAHVQGMAEALVAVLDSLGIQGWWEGRRPGIWTDAGKIAAIGVDARQGVAMHGCALNVSTDLSDYDMIVPCGLHAPVTSIRSLVGEAAPAMEAVARRLTAELASRYGCQALETTVDQIRELIG